MTSPARKERADDGARPGGAPAHRVAPPPFPSCPTCGADVHPKSARCPRCATEKPADRAAWRRLPFTGPEILCAVLFALVLALVIHGYLHPSYETGMSGFPGKRGY